MGKSKNIFLTDENANRALIRLKSYGKTCINYNYVERFGLKSLTAQLRAVAGPSAKIKISTEAFEPYDFIRLIPMKGQEVRVRVPIMPPVILSLN